MVRLRAELRGEWHLTYTKAELKELDRLTLRACSPHQLARVEARLDVGNLVKKHGQKKFDEMMAELIRQDKQRKKKAHVR